MICLTAWSPVPQQNMLIAKEQKRAQAAGGTTTETGTAGATTTAGGTAAVKNGIPIKAGSIAFGVLDTGVNSDEQSPIMASIVSGKLKGCEVAR